MIDGINLRQNVTNSLYLFQMDQIEQISVIKATGERVPYSREKLLRALIMAGAGEEQSENIARVIEPKLYDGIPSSKIHQFVYTFLKKARSHRTAGRYKLKRAIFELGPSGYPFEKFVGKLFESFGYRVEVDVIIHGKCVQHEVDVVAKKDDEVIIIEAKFRGDYRGKTTVRVPLYIQSRFNDIKAKWEDDDKYKNKKIKGYVATNARFTVDAIKYAECVGLGLISWDYPQSGSLKYFIDKSGLYPLTSLRSLRKADQKLFLEKGFVLCQELFQQQDLMRDFGFTQQKISKVLKEADLLIRS